MNNYDVTNKKFFNLLKSYIYFNNCTPTNEEIKKITGLSSPEAINYHLKKLEKQGKIKRKNGEIKILEEVC